MKSALILGSRGYIGSYLRFALSEKLSITEIDIGWFDKNVAPIDFRTLSRQYLHNFDVIILLAGHSSVRMCETDLNSSFNNNVLNFIDLLTKIEHLKFIYMSSSSIYGNVLGAGEIGLEDTSKYVATNYYDLSKHIIDQYAQLAGRNSYGLRLGTVNGFSPMLRVDVMINAMVNSAIKFGHVKVFHGDIHRPILGIKDLGRAIEKIIFSKEEHPGIYNIASFNSTSNDIGKEVAEVMNCAVIVEKVENANASKPYDFRIDSSKFEQVFDFKFAETVKSIASSLKDNFNNCVKTSRHFGIKYL